MSGAVKDMTTGKEMKHILGFTFPMLFGNIIQQLYNIVDSIIVGRVEGAVALGAIGCTNWLTFLLFACCNGLAIGAGVLVAQYFGAKQHDMSKSSIVNSFYIIAGLGVILSVLGVLVTEPVLRLMHTPESQMTDAVNYMKIICGGTISVALYNYGAQTIRALGDSKTPLLFLSMASLLNITLDILFVMEFGYGVEGAAWATVISQTVSAVGCLVYAYFKNPYFHVTGKDFAWNMRIVKECIKIGMPIAAQSMMVSLSCVFLQSMVNGFDEVVVSAFTVTSKVELFMDQPFIALGAALSTFTGQNMGADNPDRVKKAFRQSVILTVILSLILLTISFTMDEQIVSLFVKEADVIHTGAMALRIMSVMYCPLGLIFVIRGMLNGAGDSGYALMNGVVEVVGRVGFSVLLVYVIPIGIWSVWIATGLTWAITCLTAFLRYKKGIWMRVKAISK